MKLTFGKGVVHGFPIFLGYLSVSFGLGITAVSSGLSFVEATVISATNLTSAGQAAGIEIIASFGTLVEMALTQLIINLRYALMGISLSQKLDTSFSVPIRMITAFGITDEIFALSYSQRSPITPAYMLGMIFISWIGWTGGTLVGALAGSFLPAILTGALGIMLYAMFVAIVVPVARENKKVLFAALISVALSVTFKYLTRLSAGFSIIICAVFASVIAALAFPIKENKE